MTAHIENTREFDLTTQDGTRLFVRDWPLAPNGDQLPPGVLLMHGLGEHCGRYAHIARFFNALGFAVRTYDHRGHGKSSGNAGDVPDDDAILRDAQTIIQDFSQQLAAPPILLGHSMGGLFAARFVAANLAPVRALILSSPALAIRMSGFEQQLAKVALALFPGTGLPNGLKTRYLSHDAEVVQAYQNDALVHPKISARLLRSMQAAIAFTHQHVSNIAIPVLLLVAEDDHLVDPDGSRRFEKGVAPALMTAHYYDGFYHEIFNELDATPVFDDLRTWLEQQHLTPLTATSHVTGT
jgi:alpha-beta hydrolase superfamily lysophospholipase